ncbi:MAG: hypothetical protein ACLQPD_30175, partial [Desulfomonilaceae bacterium]
EKQDLPQIVGRSRLIPINVIVKLKQYVIRTFSTNFSSKIRLISIQELEVGEKGTFFFFSTVYQLPDRLLW